MDYAHEFLTFLQSRPADKPRDGSHASGSSRIHYGMSNPTMRGFVKQWKADHPTVTYADWEATLTSLYEGDSIDEHALAGFMLSAYPKFRRQLPLPVLDEWVGHLEGWREIDTTCQSNYTAQDLLANWDAWQPFLTDLAGRATIQHRRASLVFLVKPVRDSDDARLMTATLENVERLKHETDILITKAISWVLREGIKRHRDTVGGYVDANASTLPAIVFREFKKKYETGKK